MEQWKVNIYLKGTKIHLTTFSYILGAVEGSLGKVTTFICYLLPVSLSNNKTDGPFPVGIFFFF